MTRKEKFSDILVIAGLAAFAYYKYSKLSREEKDNIVNDLKETGKKMIKEFTPAEIKVFVPDILK